MIRLSGLRSGRDIDIVFTGLRPGEKLHEELLLAVKGIQATAHEKIKVTKAVFFHSDQLRMQLESLAQAINRRRPACAYCPAPSARRGPRPLAQMLH